MPRPNPCVEPETRAIFPSKRPGMVIGYRWVDLRLGLQELVDILEATFFKQDRGSFVPVLKQCDAPVS